MSAHCAQWLAKLYGNTNPLTRILYYVWPEPLTFENDPPFNQDIIINVDIINPEIIIRHVTASCFFLHSFVNECGFLDNYQTRLFILYLSYYNTLYSNASAAYVSHSYHIIIPDNTGLRRPDWTELCVLGCVWCVNGLRYLGAEWTDMCVGWWDRFIWGWVDI